MSAERIQQYFRDSAAATLDALDAVSIPIAASVDTMFAALANGNKILACGPGASAAAAQRFAAALVGGFERERPGLPAYALGADAVTRSGDETFAQQIRALGQPGDVLLAITVAPDAPGIAAALEAAHERDMTVVALTGLVAGAPADGVPAGLADTDIAIAVPSARAARIHEVHLLTLHCLCDGIDAMLLGED